MKDTLSEKAHFVHGLHSTLGNVRDSIDLMDERLQMEKYAEMHATYRGMRAAWRICETALINEIREQENLNDQP